jgi:hypothetical protein
MKYSFQKQAQKQHTPNKLNLITLEELMSDSKYRVMSNQELTDFLSRWDNSISIEDYKKLEGQFASDKAKILKEKWAKEIIVEPNPITITTFYISLTIKQKEFEKGQILYSLWDDGYVSMCVFDKKVSDVAFDCGSGELFNFEGKYRNSFSKSLINYFNKKKIIQWQLATMEQIKQYGYEKYLDYSVQFPDIQPEKEVDIKEQKRWIPLSEQLPPIGKDVVFAQFKGDKIVQYVVKKSYTGWVVDGSTRSTHWCDCLPDAPNPIEKEAVSEKLAPSQLFTITEDMWELMQQRIIRTENFISKQKEKEAFESEKTKNKQ